MLAGDGGEKIAFQEAKGNSVAFGVFLCDCQGGGGQVNGGYPRLRQVVSERDGDAAGAGAHIDDARRWKAGGNFEGLLDQMFRLWAGNQDIGRDAKGQAVELGLADDVLDRLAPVAAFEQFGVTAGFGGGKLFIGMGQQPGLGLFENVEEQSVGILAGAVGVRAGGQADRAF